MRDPSIKKFCCETMERAWKDNTIGWEGDVVTMLYPYPHGQLRVFRDEPIRFCPWCGFKLKVRRD